MRFPPPLLYGAGLVLGALLDRALPWNAAIPGAWRLGVALPLLALGLALDVWALLALRRARTTVLPWARADALVTRGPFRVSRNPIYLGYTLEYLAIALWLDLLWALALLPIVLVVMTRYVVAREERHLAARFGEAYDAYRGRVRRWL